jgi:hypothetical protein
MESLMTDLLNRNKEIRIALISKIEECTETMENRADIMEKYANNLVSSILEKVGEDSEEVSQNLQILIDQAEYMNKFVGDFDERLDMALTKSSKGIFKTIEEIKNMVIKEILLVVCWKQVEKKCSFCCWRN